MRDFKKQYLRVYRLLCLLLAVLTPTFAVINTYVHPENVSPPVIREVLMGLGVIILIGSYREGFILRNIQKIMLALYSLVFTWQYWVMYVNQFNPNNVFGFFIIATAVSVGFENRKMLGLFLSAAFVGTVVLVLNTEITQISIVLFLTSLFSIFVMLFFVNVGKFIAENDAMRYNKEITQKNREITDSLTYAKRIQAAILPSDMAVKRIIPKSFVMYMPKDIVAGDFYWVEEMNSENRVIFAAADCTGHGVPGAMMSVVCNNALNRAVKEFGLRSTGPILDQARNIVIQELDYSGETVHDGMDIALCVVDRSSKKLTYSGANNPIWIVRRDQKVPFEGTNSSKMKVEQFENCQFLEVRGDRQPVGQFSRKEPFTTHTIDICDGDFVYVATDGYVDQFGGDKGKKLKAKTFQNLVVGLAQTDIDKQGAILKDFFHQWKGDFEQIDDVCVVGVEV